MTRQKPKKQNSMSVTSFSDTASGAGRSSQKDPGSPGSIMHLQGKWSAIKTKLNTFHTSRQAESNKHMEKMTVDEIVG